MNRVTAEFDDETLSKIVEDYDSIEDEAPESDTNPESDDAAAAAKQKEWEQLVAKKRAALKNKFLARAEKLARR